MVAATVTTDVIYVVTPLSRDSIEITALPIVEELLKLWLVFKFSEHAFAGIVTFGLMELLLVKAPYLIIFQDAGDLVEIMTTVLIVLGFHISTAIPYRTVAGSRRVWIIFGICAASHMLFNALSLLHLNHLVWSVLGISVCSFVASSGRLGSGPIKSLALGAIG